MERIELLRELGIQLVDKWETLLDSDPRRVAREVRTYLRWVEGVPTSTPDGEAIRATLIEFCIELIAEAEARSP